MSMSLKSFGEKHKEKINKALNKFSQHVIIKTIMAGMARVLPVTLVGSFALLVANIPYEPFTEVITNIGLYKYLNLVATLTNDMISIYLVAVLAYEMSKFYKKSAINAVILAMLCYFIVNTTNKSYYW